MKIVRADVYTSLCESDGVMPNTPVYGIDVQFRSGKRRQYADIHANRTVVERLCALLINENMDIQTLEDICLDFSASDE